MSVITSNIRQIVASKLQLLQFRSFVSSYNTETIPIITQPVHWTKKQVKRQEAVKEKLFKEKQRSDSLKNKKVQITCSNSKLNLYQGTYYGKFETLPLASQGWTSSNSKGQNFTINCLGPNPAVAHESGSFQDGNFEEDIKKAIHKMGFREPTNIQAAAMPIISNGHNTLIAAETGNGKTLAFLVPLLQQLLKARLSELESSALNSPSLVVIAPGRELALQIEHVCQTLCADLPLTVSSVQGADHTKKKMKYPELVKMDILVATPGVFTKLASTGVIRTNLVRHIVMDEADTLLDDSFIDLTKRILRQIPVQNGKDTMSGAQLVLSGATLPRSIKAALAGIVEVDSLERVDTPGLHRVLPHVTQRFFRVGTQQKIDKVLKIAQNAHENNRSILIFSNTSDTAHWIGHMLKAENIECVHIGGKQDSRMRKLFYKSFVNQDTYVLSATDIISRGLDTSQVCHVINYDVPKFMSDYIHRCGRVGRVGSQHKSPLVTTFVTKKFEVELVQKIETAVRRGQTLPDVDGNIKKVVHQDFKKREDNHKTRQELKIVRKEIKDEKRILKLQQDIVKQDVKLSSMALQ